MYNYVEGESCDVSFLDFEFVNHNLDHSVWANKHALDAELHRHDIHKRQVSGSAVDDV